MAANRQIIIQVNGVTQFSATAPQDESYASVAARAQEAMKLDGHKAWIAVGRINFVPAS